MTRRGKRDDYRAPDRVRADRPRPRPRGRTDRVAADEPPAVLTRPSTGSWLPLAGALLLALLLVGLIFLAAALR